MSSPGAFESLARTLMKDRVKEILSKQPDYCIAAGVTNPSKHHYVLCAAIEAVALSHALASIQDVPDDCKLAFSAGWQHEVEKALSSKGIQLSEFHSKRNDLSQAWAKVCDSSDNRTAEFIKMGIAIARAFRPEAGVVEGSGINSLFVASMKNYGIAVQACSSLPATETRSTSEGKAGCLIPILVALGTVVAIGAWASAN